MKLVLSAFLLIALSSCASSETQDNDRFPASDGHSSLPKRAVDHDYWASCIKERSEAYCRRRLGR